MSKWPPYPVEYPSAYIEPDSERIIPDKLRDLQAAWLLMHANKLHEELEDLLQHPERLKALQSPNQGRPANRELDIAIKFIEIEQDLRRARQSILEIKNGWPANRPFRRT